jgi:hypothetical protein
MIVFFFSLLNFLRAYNCPKRAYRHSNSLPDSKTICTKLNVLSFLFRPSKYCHDNLATPRRIGILTLQAKENRRILSLELPCGALERTKTNHDVLPRRGFRERRYLHLHINAMIISWLETISTDDTCSWRCLKCIKLGFLYSFLHSLHCFWKPYHKIKQE